VHGAAHAYNGISWPDATDAKTLTTTAATMPAIRSARVMMSYRDEEDEMDVDDEDDSMMMMMMKRKRWWW